MKNVKSIPRQKNFPYTLHGLELQFEHKDFPAQKMGEECFHFWGFELTFSKKAQGLPKVYEP